MLQSLFPSPDLSTLGITEDLAPLPTYKVTSTTTVNFSSLLEPGLKLREDLSTGCGGQLWPAGMILAQHILRYHRLDLKDARILEIGAGGGLVGLAIASGCSLSQPLYVTDQQNMLGLMQQNINMNQLDTRVKPLILNWGEDLPPEVVAFRPNVILAADCVYFEPAFPLLQATLADLASLCEDVTIYFCFQKRRKADMHFMRSMRKQFDVEEVEDQDRPNFSKQGVFLVALRKKSRKGRPLESR